MVVINGIRNCWKQEIWRSQMCLNSALNRMSWKHWKLTKRTPNWYQQSSFTKSSFSRLGKTSFDNKWTMYFTMWKKGGPLVMKLQKVKMLKIVEIQGWILFWSVHRICTVLWHGPLSLYTKLEGPSIMELEFYLQRYGLGMIFH